MRRPCPTLFGFERRNSLRVVIFRLTASVAGRCFLRFGGQMDVCEDLGAIPGYQVIIAADEAVPKCRALKVGVFSSGRRPQPIMLRAKVHPSVGGRKDRRT